MTLAIVDYGAGNLRSVAKAFDFIDQKCIITSSVDELKSSSGIVLRGVGAFREAAGKLKEAKLWETLKIEAEKGKALFGICLGMQLLFDESSEFGRTDGLGLIKGKVDNINTGGQPIKIPHIGWNNLCFNKKSALYDGIENGTYVYFVHSFSAKTEDENVTAYTDYGINTVASVERKNVLGTQFHPEKSGVKGLRILKNFCDMVKHDNFTCN